MRVLVTGGLGFLGHAVVRQLVDRGHLVTALSSRLDGTSRVPGVATAHADIRDRAALARVLGKVEPHGICHLAALTRLRDSFDNPLAFFDVNVGGTIALLDALHDSDRSVPIVLASTGAVYGQAEGRINEDAPTLPTNPYSASKLAAEQLVHYHAQTGAIGATILRCFNIAGAVDGIGDSDTTRIIPKALAVAAGKAEKLTVNGDGSAIREFTHVADVAAAFTAALSATEIGSSSTFNVGSGQETKISQVITAVEQVTGCKLMVEHVPPKSEPRTLMANSDRIRDRLGWRPALINIWDIVSSAWHAEPLK